tara:strand:+ start:281 stop:934 length:654 start_codon:yes stop_codon:yes gene_type:complete
MKEDFIIILAWPEGLVAAAGSWYDRIFAANGKYRVGHSALVLVNSRSNKLEYFDFGRYHTPVDFGRVRDVETDPDLLIKQTVIIKDNTIENIQSILLELAALKATHGEGKMFASILSNVSFEKGYQYAKLIQGKGAIVYGPLARGGTNCSRFVASTMRAANSDRYTNLRLKYPFCLSPSPKRNISIANSNYYVIDNKICKHVKKSFIKGYFSSIENV